MAVTYEPIATTTLSSAAATITFSSIPSTYTDLKLVLVGNATSTSGSRFRLNNDSGGNYSYTMLAGDGASAASIRGTGNTNGLLGPAYVSPSSSIPYLCTLDIFSYSGSTYKTIIGTASNDLNGSGSVERTVQLYQSTSAINQVNLYVNLSGNFAAGTTATLYGIKAA